MKKMSLDRKRLSVSAFDPENVDLIMREKPSQFTDEEIAALCLMDLKEPSSEELEKFNREYGQQNNTLTLIEEEEEDGEGAQDVAEKLKIARKESAEKKKQLEEEEEEELRAGSVGKSQRPLSSRNWRRPMSRPGTSGVSSPMALRNRQAPSQNADAASNNHSSGLMMRKEDLFTVLTKADLVGDSDIISESVLKVKNVELIERGLTSTLVVETFLNATHVYLQHNAISDLDGLQLLAHLKILVVHHNKVYSLQPLALLDELQYVDASDNCIASLQPQWDLPVSSLQYINLVNNPCVPPVTDDKEYLKFCCSISDVCPNITHVNDISLETGSDEEEDDDTQTRRPHSSEAAPVTETKSRARLQQTLQAAKDASYGPGDSTSSSAVKPALNEDEERLLRQYKERAKTRNLLFTEANVDRTKTDNAEAEAGDNGHWDPQHAVGMEGGAVLGDFLDRELTEARLRHTKMYTDISYANSVAQDKLVRSIEEQWAGVAKVVQSRHSAVTERRRRLLQSTTGDNGEQVPVRSEAYKDAIALLKEECKCTDVSNYRKEYKGDTQSEK